MLGLIPALSALLVGCPATIQLTTPSLAVVPAGWTVIIDNAPHRLNGLTLYDGPVADGASLVPDSQTTKHGSMVAVWRLANSRERPYWFVCRYSGTNLTLARQLPVDVQRCAAVYSADIQIEGLPEIKTIDCQ